MKKIPTLFKREFEGHNIVRVLPELSDESLRWVLDGDGTATVKIDGSCCAIIDGVFYKRYDAKRGKAIPDGAIKCQEAADPVTGHLPCWVKVDPNNPADRWFIEAEKNVNYVSTQLAEFRTYEAIGKHFNSNPYNLDYDTLIPHGTQVIDVERTFEGIKKYLEENYIEGIVFWKDGEPQCKIKRSDFGFEWATKKHS
jgi:hypothetical protein